MKFVKILILALAFPMVMQASDQRPRSASDDQPSVCFCLCACVKKKAEARSQENPSEEETQKQKLKDYYKTHPKAVNMAVRTGSKDLDTARKQAGKPINSPSYVAYKDKMKLAKEAALEVQAEAAGVAVDAWASGLLPSTDARNRRPHQVYHQKEMEALHGAAVPKARERTASMEVQHPEGSLAIAAQEGEKPHEPKQPSVFTFVKLPNEGLTPLTMRQSVVEGLASDTTPKFALGAFMDKRERSATVSLIPGQIGEEA